MLLKSNHLLTIVQLRRLEADIQKSKNAKYNIAPNFLHQSRDLLPIEIVALRLESMFQKIFFENFSLKPFIYALPQNLKFTAELK